MHKIGRFAEIILADSRVCAFIKVSAGSHESAFGGNAIFLAISRRPNSRRRLMMRPRDWPTANLPGRISMSQACRVPVTDRQNVHLSQRKRGYLVEKCITSQSFP